MEENKNALDEINKGCTMAIEAINDLIEKVDNKEFMDLLENQLNQYDIIEYKIQSLYEKYSDSKPHEINAVNKVMSASMINMKTLTDHTDSKIAELLLQGTNMGIIEGRRILNNKKLENAVEDIINEFVGSQEKYIELLKKYL